MTMSTSPLTKAAIVGLAAGVLLALTEAAPERLLVVAAGAALVCLAWIRLERSSVRAERRAQPIRRDSSERWVAPRPPRIDRTPTGRQPRDVRCSVSPPSRPSRR